MSLSPAINALPYGQMNGNSSFPWQSFLGHLDDFCQCPEGTEMWFRSCMPACPMGTLRDAKGECVCPLGHYKVLFPFLSLSNLY